MAVPVAKNQFTTGEISPSFLGRQDVERYHSAGTTVRNFFCSYVGPLYSRAGTAFVGYSKQTGRGYPPRLIDFQFALNQGLVLEFGNFYMRVISNGAFVTETPLLIVAATNSNPATLTVQSEYGVASATTNVAGVISSYAPGDTVTLAGGTYATPGVLEVTGTEVLNAYVGTAGTGYAPDDTLVFAGGTHSVAATGTVSTTQVVSATVASVGSGGTAGEQIVTGTTGVGTYFQAIVTVNGSGQITAVDSIFLGGVYTTNPTTITDEPVTGGGLSGAALNVVMGMQSVAVTTPGAYTANPTGGVLTQASTSGSGVGAQCVGTFAPTSVSVATVGTYSTEPANPVSQASTSGLGLGATFNVSFMTVSAPLSVADWIYVSGMLGLTQLNGETFVISAISGSVVTLSDVFGNAIDTTLSGVYSSGGSVAKIFTLATPYAEIDLPWLKDVQSADTMSLCLVDQVTGVEYAPQDLTRTSDTNWSFSPVVPAPSVPPPVSVIGTASSGGSVDYQYVVTSVDPTDGTESIASPIANIPSAVDIAGTAGSITVQWSAVTGVNEYYVYKALPAYGTTVAVGSQFAYAGFSYGNSFVDSNITADFSQSPPTHQNPFARGAILGGEAVVGGAGYTTAEIAITTSTGSGAVLSPVLENGVLVGVLVDNEGENYEPGDEAVVTGNGVGAVVTLEIGPQSGTYPSLPAYFQERRGYANTLNNPDTYWFSQPGAFTNFDVRNPTIASDAITGSPWAVQVNGVQWMIQTSGGLLVMTGLRAWMLVGAGSFATNVQPISPSNQNDVPQAFTGSSPLIEPILVNFDVIYVDPNSVYFYDLPYQLYTLSEPIDLTDISAHLFTGYNVKASAYCEKPYRLIWSVRSDGALLSLTYYKTQKVQGWGRHDTQGLFVGVASIIEPPVDAAYFATQRFINGNSPYMIERMDNRIWPNAESVWAVDCGLSYPQPTPAATLSVSSATGSGSLTGATGIIGGALYSAGTVGTVVDQFNGPGTGAVPTLTFSGGALAGVSFPGSSGGIGYAHPLLIINDPAGSAGGSGASAKLTLNNNTILKASAAVFSVGNVGSVVRGGGGIAVITQYLSPTSVAANVLSPFASVVLGSGVVVAPIASGAWTMTAPITTVSGLGHLVGATVTGLADGNVIPPTVVSAAGTITLATPASAIVVGLGFQCQFQDVPIDLGNPTVQGQRKKLTATTVRLDASRGVKVGSNQQDGSSLSPSQLATTWSNMEPLPDKGPGTPNFPPVPYNALCTPLRTGDVRTALAGGTVTPGQLCIQQDYPLPCNVVGIYSEVLPGDTPQTQAPQKKGGGG